jgi:hypothetical protein
MLIENVMEVLVLLLSQDFIDQFVFIWGCEQCSMTLSQFIARNYYCFKDLNHMYFACQGLPYREENQTLFIDDELNKSSKFQEQWFVFWNLLKNISCPKINCNGWSSFCNCSQC